MSLLKNLRSKCQRRLEATAFAAFAVLWTASLAGCQANVVGGGTPTNPENPVVTDSLVAKYGAPMPVDSIQVRYGVVQPPTDTLMAKYGAPMPLDSIQVRYGVIQPPVDIPVAKYGIPYHRDTVKTSYEGSKTPAASDRDDAA